MCFFVLFVVTTSDLLKVFSFNWMFNMSYNIAAVPSLYSLSVPPRSNSLVSCHHFWWLQQLITARAVSCLQQRLPLVVDDVMCAMCPSQLIQTHNVLFVKTKVKDRPHCILWGHPVTNKKIGLANILIYDWYIWPHPFSRQGTAHLQRAWY